MPTQYHIDARNRIVFTTFTGEITFEEVVAHAVALKGDRNFHPGFSELLDLRSTTVKNLSFDELRRLAETIDPFSRQTRRAIVAPQDLNDTSRMYQAARGDDIQVFRDLESAQKWLEISQEQARYSA